MKLLLLFDIDGTLLRGGTSAHAQSLRAALHRIYGLGSADGSEAGLPSVQMAGRTDLEIARAIALACGLPNARFDQDLPEFTDEVVREYEGRDEDLSGYVAEGVTHLLADLGEREDMICSLLTGNLEPIARIKLARAGIGGHFAPGQGAFGSDAEDRRELPEIARLRAGHAGTPHPRARTVVIGDTPRDIACAHFDGVGCVAVATGPYTVEQLLEADAVVERASELSELLSAMARALGGLADPL